MLSEDYATVRDVPAVRHAADRLRKAHADRMRAGSDVGAIRATGAAYKAAEVALNRAVLDAVEVRYFGSAVCI